MFVRLLDPDGKGHTGGEIDGEVLPAVGAIFLVDGYPLRCDGHVRAQDDDLFPGIVVGDAPEHMFRDLLKPGTEELAKENYAFSCSMTEGAPPWEKASPLNRRKFRLDAENLRPDLDQQGRAPTS